MKARLVEAMCAVPSQALVLCGEAGVGNAALREYLVRPFDPDCAIETAGEGRAGGEAEILADVHRRDQAGVRGEARAVLPGVAQAVAEYVSVCKLRRCAGC